MAEVVGTAYVRIRALTNQLGSDIKRGLDKGVKDSESDKQGNLLGENVAEGFGETLDKELPDRLQKSTSEAIQEVDVEQDTDKLGGRIQQGIARGMSKDPSLGGSMKKSFTKAFRGIEFPKFTWLAILGVPALNTAVGIIGKYLLGIIAQLGWLAQAAIGAGAAFTAAFVGAGLAIVPLFLAFKTETPALEAFKESMKELGEEWDVRWAGGTGGSAPCPGSSGQHRHRRSAPSLHRVQPGNRDHRWNTAILLADTLATTESQEAMGRIFDASTEIFQSLSDAVVDLFEAFIPLLYYLLDAPCG